LTGRNGQGQGAEENRPNSTNRNKERKLQENGENSTMSGFIICALTKLDTGNTASKNLFEETTGFEIDREQ
jgi:hypothetical protein